jgi:hypothetical protein
MIALVMIPQQQTYGTSLAVGSLAFIETVKSDLRVKAAQLDAVELDGSYTLREPTEASAGKSTGEKHYPSG